VSNFGQLLDFALGSANTDIQAAQAAAQQEMELAQEVCPRGIGRCGEVLAVLQALDGLPGAAVDRELLDAGASDAFAVADHQVAHVYTKPGVEVDESVFADCEVERIDHERAGRYVLVAERGHWFTHDYWLADAHKPDFAHCVDIHRKPGYDPRELFSRSSMPAIAWKLLRKRLGFRQLMDVVPLDATLVQGTHGRIDNPPELQPVMLGGGHQGETLPCTAVRDVLLEAMGLG